MRCYRNSITRWERHAGCSERVPESEFAWKPHDKSFSLGQLAGHVANIPTWVGHILQNSVFDVSTAGDTRPRQPESLAILLADFDKNVKAARAGIAATGDGEMLAPWTFKSGEQVVFTMPQPQRSAPSS